MSCGDGSGHQLDTGFGAGWSNNLNEGTVLKTRNSYQEIGLSYWIIEIMVNWSKTVERKTFGKNIGNLYGP